MTIWIEEDPIVDIFPYYTTFMEPVTSIALPSKRESVQRTMTVFKTNSFEYHIAEILQDRTDPSPRLPIEVDINLKTLQITPLYAIPSSRQKPLELILQSGGKPYNPDFQTLGDIYELQHLLTGYRVFDRSSKTL